MKRFIFAFFTSLLQIGVSAILPAADLQAQSITWSRLYDTPGINQSVSKATCMADNGNFYSGGTMLISASQGWRIYVMKLNPYGDTIWTRRIDTLAAEVYAMAPTGDGGCVIVGDNHYSIKLDLNGNIVWAKYYGDSRIWLYDIIKTSDGGYIACGELFDQFTFTSNGYVMKLDAGGNLVWQQTYLTNDWKKLSSIIELAGGIFALTGTDSDFFGDTVKVLLLKLNSVGAIILDKEYTIMGKGGNGFSIAEINNQFLIGSSSSDTTGTYVNTCFIRTDTSGNLLYVKKYEANRNELFYDMKIMNSNKYIFTRMRDFYPAPSDSYVMIMDSVGNSIKEKSFALSGWAAFWSILLMPNGDFIFAGNGKHSISPSKTYIVRADSNLYAPPIGITNTGSVVPHTYVLKQNYPNPFNSSTIVEFELKAHSKVEIRLFDPLGRYLSTLLSKELLPGGYKIQFNANHYASGIYFYQMVVDGLPLKTNKMVMIK